MKKKIRRFLLLIILITVFSGLEPIVKLLIGLPTLQLLIMDYSDFTLLNHGGMNYEKN